MKKLFFAFALMGIVSSAHADEYDNFLQCVQAFHNDQNVIDILNDGNPNARDAHFKGIKEIVKNYDTIKEQRSALSSSGKADAAYRAARGFEIAYSGLLLFHVADKCPKYFMNFLNYYSREKRTITDELSLRMVLREVDGKRQIRFATQKDWEKTADEDKLLNGISIGFDSNFAGEFYMLILPKTLYKNPDEWLSYEEGRNALKDYANSRCGNGWYTVDYTGARTDYFVDLIDHVNITKSFPGLLVPLGSTYESGYKTTDSVFVRDNNPGKNGGKAEYVAVRNLDKSMGEEKFGSIAHIIEKSRAFQQMLKNDHCAKTDDFVIYAASPYHPMHIVNERIGDAFYQVIEKEKKEKPLIKPEYQEVIKDGAAVVGFGVAGLVGGGMAAYYGLKALGLKMGLTATAAGTAGGATAGGMTAGGFAAGSLATIVGIGVGLWGVLYTVSNAFEKMEEPVPVTGYDQMYIYYKTPLKDLKLDDSQYHELHKILKAEEVQTTSSSSGSLAVPGGNAGTPAKPGNKKVITNEFVF